MSGLADPSGAVRPHARGKETAQRLYGGSRECHLPTRNIWTTTIATDGCAGYSASTATVVLASSVTVP